MGENPNRPLHVDEKIVAAALFMGVIWSLPSPARHHTVMHAMMNAGINSDKIHFAEQGFTTSEGRFVGRELAKDIAWRAGQTETFDHPTKLFSEDLW